MNLLPLPIFSFLDLLPFMARAAAINGNDVNFILTPSLGICLLLLRENPGFLQTRSDKHYPLIGTVHSVGPILTERSRSSFVTRQQNHSFTNLFAESRISPPQNTLPRPPIRKCVTLHFPSSYYGSSSKNLLLRFQLTRTQRMLSFWKH